MARFGLKLLNRQNKLFFHTPIFIKCIKLELSLGLIHKMGLYRVFPYTVIKSPKYFCYSDLLSFLYFSV